MADLPDSETLARGLDYVGDCEDRRRPFGGLGFHQQAQALRQLGSNLDPTAPEPEDGDE